jgi:hypothetical protein
MRCSHALLLAVYAGLSAAHADPNQAGHGFPKIVGGRKILSELRAKGVLGSRAPAPRPQPVDVQESGEVREARGELRERQNTSGKCGVQDDGSVKGSCAKGYCCSPEG